MFRRLAPVAVVIALLAVVGCANTQSGPAAPAPSVAGAFPVTVEHKYGSTTVEAKPERVVSVGLTEQDVLLQLGVIPIAVTDWYGDQPHATWPWAQKLLGDAKPTVLTTTSGIQFEKVAQLGPDLIVGTNAGLSKQDYDKLSQIAPVVTSVAGSTPYFSAWDAQTLQIAKALGQEAAGAELVARTKQLFAQAKAEHPEFAGKTATFSQGAPYEGSLYVYPAGLSTQFLTDLGLTITPGLEKYQKESGGQAVISAELADAIDADVIVFATESAENFNALQKWPATKNIAAVRENRAAYTDATLAGAIYFTTPLSLEYVAANLTPKLAEAASGSAPRRYPG